MASRYIYQILTFLFAGNTQELLHDKVKSFLFTEEIITPALNPPHRITATMVAPSGILAFMESE